MKKGLPHLSSMHHKKIRVIHSNLNLKTVGQISKMLNNLFHLTRRIIMFAKWIFNYSFPIVNSAVINTSVLPALENRYPNFNICHCTHKLKFSSLWNRPFLLIQEVYGNESQVQCAWCWMRCNWIVVDIHNMLSFRIYWHS